MKSGDGGYEKEDRTGVIRGIKYLTDVIGRWRLEVLLRIQIGKLGQKWDTRTRGTGAGPCAPYTYAAREARNPSMQPLFRASRWMVGFSPSLPSRHAVSLQRQLQMRHNPTVNDICNWTSIATGS